MIEGKWKHMSMLDLEMHVFAVIPTRQAWKCSVVWWNPGLPDHMNPIWHEQVVVKRDEFWKWRTIGGKDGG